MYAYTDHLTLLQRLEQVRVRAEEMGTALVHAIAATAHTVRGACDAFGRVGADASRLVSAAQPFWEHDLLIAALVARGHVIDLSGGGDTPHVVIDGVHATFAEAVAFHRGLVTLADIEDWGALSGRTGVPVPLARS